MLNGSVLRYLVACSRALVGGPYAGPVPKTALKVSELGLSQNEPAAMDPTYICAHVYTYTESYEGIILKNTCLGFPYGIHANEQTM